jgi:anti-anti-sigma regulatory factor
MKAVKKISVYESLGISLNTREAAAFLMKTVEKTQSLVVELDFSNVEFMSRSFADQFHKERSAWLETNNGVIAITNANEEIITILQIVSKTQDKRVREYSTIPVFKFSDKNILKNYLLSSI